MGTRSQSLTAISFGLLVVYGLVLGVYTVFFIAACFDKMAVLNSSLFAGKFNNISEFQRHTVLLWLIFSPQFIGLIAAIRLQEWGRKLVIITSGVICLYFLLRMVFELKGFDLNSALLAAIYLSVMAFFNWPSVQEQFKEGAKKKILIVDDDKGLLKMMKLSLSHKGFEVLTAETGEQGLEIAKRQKPDLIILDVILPKIKGREVCARLKEDNSTIEIPVVFLTSKSSPDDVKAELELGAVSHLTKPLDIEQVLHEINRVLGIEEKSP